MGTVTHLPVVGREITAADYAANHDIALDAADVTDALGYVPADDANLSANYYTETQVDQLLSLVTHDPSPLANGLISGGQVTWESGLTFRVTASTYRINNVVYTAAEQTKTLAAADVSNPRIDVLVLNTAGALAAVQGDAAADPSEPDIDQSTQLKLTFVLIAAGETTPTGVTITNIYLENTEWTTSTSGTGINANSTNNPKSGTKCVEGTNMANLAYVLFDKGAVDLDINTQRMLRMYIRSKAAWANGRVLRAQWYANGVAKGAPVTIASGYWGFDSSQISAYQLVAIPISQFVVPAGTLVDQLRITDVNGAIGFYLDEVTLESLSSISGGSNTFITIEQGDIRYAPILLAPATVTGTTYATTATDIYVSKLFTSGSPITVTLNSSPPIGSRVRMMRMGAGTLTVAAGGGMTLRSRDAAVLAVGQYSVLEAHRISATEWAILGDVG